MALKTSSCGVSVLIFFLAQFANLDEFEGLGKITIDPVVDSVKQEVAIAIGEANSVLADTSFLSNTLKDNAGIRTTKNEKPDSSQIKTFNNFTTEEREELIENIKSDTAISDGMRKALAGGLSISEKANVFYEKFLKNISYVLFLLMPFFALLLAMTLWKSGMLYVHHLIFSINFHSFIFGLSSIIIISGMIFPEVIAVYFSYLFLGIPVYLLFGIKRFYNRSYISAFFKTIGVLILYSFIIFIVIIMIFAITAQGFYEI